MQALLKSYSNMHIEMYKLILANLNHYNTIVRQDWSDLELHDNILSFYIS